MNRLVIIVNYCVVLLFNPHNSLVIKSIAVLVWGREARNMANELVIFVFFL